MIEVRPADAGDEDAIWGVLEPVVRAGETFMNDPASSREEVLAGWGGSGVRRYLAELEGATSGAYMLRPKQPGLGSHVANASFAVAPEARGRGVGRAMGEHAIAEARRLGYRGMQFNAVVSTNEGAIALWRSLGFEEAGRIPGAFRLRERYVDTLVMYRRLI